ncbi:MAG: DNA polymerase ligase N-terminal domain-containing protein [archaeon]|nr:DNA polymerase ligase N-terminal domain-containing protein [archaeon]
MLEEYKKKRDFKKTAEPEGERSKDEKEENIFVIQEHHARNLHYDLRLEIKGVLKSWAVPKEPPEKPGIKRLAIRTEDHPLNYADFEGIIPEGQYGAGEVKIWDRGTFIPEKITGKEILFHLEGKRMKGDYVLIKTGFGKNSWLFFKKKD